MLIEHGAVTRVIAFLHIYLGEQGTYVAAIIALSMSVDVLVEVAMPCIYRVELVTATVIKPVINDREEHKFSAVVVMEHLADLTIIIDLARYGLYATPAP